MLRYPMLATNMLSPSAEHVAHAAASPHHQLITIDECRAGSCVSSLQTLLNGKGASIAVDGDFGPATLAAVKSFQSSRGLAVRAVSDSTLQSEPLTFSMCGHARRCHGCSCCP